MSKLSEEEIINWITPIVNARKTHKDDNLYSLHLNAYQLDGLQGLLNLYKQNEESCTKYLAEIGQLRTKLHAEKEKNKELIQGQVKTLDEILQPELLKKYISKDKIREKIKEWDKGIAWANADDHYYAIKILKEILEEE